MHKVPIVFVGDKEDMCNLQMHLGNYEGAGYYLDNGYGYSVKITYCPFCGIELI
jgi:hypothetical protein